MTVGLVRANMVLGRGWAGFLTIGFLTSFYVGRILTDLLEYDGYYYGHKVIAIGIGVAAIAFTAGVGTMLNRQKIKYDPETRRSVITRNWHLVFYIPIQYWSVVALFLMLLDLGHNAPAR